MLDNSYGDEALEELTTAVIMMAQIQPADDNAVSKPSYDAKAASEVNALNKVHEQVNHAKCKTIIHTFNDDQIDSNTIFDDPYVENNCGTSEHESNAHDEYHDIQMLAYIVQREAENQKQLNNELKKQKELLQKEIETFKDRLAKKAFKEQESRYLDDIVDLEEKLSSHDRIVHKIDSAYTISIHSQCFYIVNLYSYKLAITLSRLQRAYEIPPPPPSSSQTPTQQTPHTVSTIKLPILKKGEYDIWAMKMEHYLAHTDYPIWEVIQNGNGPVSITTDTQGQIKVLPPRTAEEILARERERKARTTLLMALPEDHLAKFHKMTDAKEMWDAIKSRFGGNDESKKMQKFQSLPRQLEIHGAGVSTEDANQKFLRSLPFAWSQVSLIMRTKPGVDSLSFDDLYNNLRVFENDVKGSTASSSSTQNMAFVSENTSSTNDVSTAYSVSNTSGQNSQYEQTSSYSLLANQSSYPQLDHEDLEQLDEFDLEEMDLKWQVAMISMRMKKFYKTTSRKLQFDAKEPVGFDKTKVECYNCHKTGHFARECRYKGNQDSRRIDAWNSSNKDGRRSGKQEDSKALVTIDGEGVDWTSHSEEEEDYALMACNSSGSVSHPAKAETRGVNKNRYHHNTWYTSGQIKVLPPRTAEEIVARERERKARTTLLMALPEDHLAKFHKMTDAKEIWDAIKTRFGGNAENKENGKRSEEDEDYALMACNNSDSDIEVTSCSNECKESYAKLKKLYDEQRAQLSDASIEIKTYTQGLKKIEAQLVAHQQGQLWYEQKIKFTKIDLDDKTDMSAHDKFGLGYGDHIYDGILSYENEVLQSVFKGKESDFKNPPLNNRSVTTDGMHAVPPPMTGNYMPSGPNVEIDYSQFTYGPKQTQPSEFESQTSEFDTCESNISTEPSELVSEPVVNESNVECQPKVWSDAPIIEEYESDSEEECVISA
ncbi:ribonuclease H-like domain-containing protein [Tanacetum coccineum]